MYLEKPVAFSNDADLAFLWFPLPGNTVAAKRIGHGYGGIVFVEVPFLDLKDVKVALPQPLQMADVGLTDLVAFSECRTFKLASPDFGDVVGKDRSYRVFNVYDPLAHFSL